MKDEREHTRADRSAADENQAKSLQLHRRCLEGEPTAQAQLYELFAGQVCRILASGFATLQASHPDWIDDAVADGLTDYLVHPARYDPDRKSLLGYLVMLAEGDLRNRRDREWRQGWEGRGEDEGSSRIIRLGDEDDESVGKHLHDRNVDVEAQVLSALLEDGDFAYVLRRSITDDDDWKVLQLLADGATSTEHYVAALGLDVPAGKMREVAKRASDHKERVRKRARRCWEAYSDGRQVRQYKRRTRGTKGALGPQKDTPE
jgi:hypothetical protein